MRTQFFELVFVKPEKGQFPGGPRAHIGIKSISLEKHPSGMPFKVIGDRMHGPCGVIYEIDRLIKELEYLRKIALKRFAASDNCLSHSLEFDFSIHDHAATLG